MLGMLLMRANFVPGLTSLDTSAQIIGWAIIFGYAQQLFPRLADAQGRAVLNGIRTVNSPPDCDPPPKRGRATAP
ncbi:hypothetical protein E1265_01745 [Streptomyces sp. 8K308]|uniref:hypothetical protein n=1 Tax=Streptomyces sp. 8K308 TaxID=2530388 RepID=UPI001052F902|nr:hypothetical protein [Streptomyces sp. 8K308]TDC27435.1 hypothetical protein E1265_01745 [Streptomyces sp. 8K308]